MQLFADIYLKIFFILTPFFVLSAFLALTPDFTESARSRLALRVTIAVMVVSVILFLAGKYIFAVFGITLDAFRIGAGTLLLLSAIALVRGAPLTEKAPKEKEMAVVPLAIPITVGPATTGVLLVMGADMNTPSGKAVALSALLCAALTVGILLWTAGRIERRIGKTGLSILSKLTGLMLASLAAQMIMTGVRNFMS